MAERPPRRVALIGWDAADWKIIHPLLDRGLMPHFRKLVERGVMGQIATLEPALSPILWTSIATGKTGDQHRILGFLEPDPVGGGVRPVASSSRQSQALWNILDGEGLRSLVVNWFASHPAERIRGACVSNAFAKHTAPHKAAWPMPADAVHPASLADTIAGLRMHAGDLTGDDLLSFIPNLTAIDQTSDKRPLALGAVLAETISTHAAATWLMENEPWDFLAVYYDAIDHAGHVFMRYHAPRMENISEEDFENYKEVMNGLYCFHDMMLGRIVELAGPDAHIILLSDHGFESGRFRPREALGSALDNPLRWHRTHGVFCMAGPGIRKDELVYGAGLLDVAPTVLTLLGLRPGADMPGRVLAEAFESAPSTERIASWEKASDNLPGAATEGVWDASAVLAQLAALGYIDTVAQASGEQTARVQADCDFNLAKIHIAAERWGEAIALLEKLGRESADGAATTYRMYLVHCYSQSGRTDECRAIAGELLARDPEGASANVIRGNLALMEGDVDTGLAFLLKAEAGWEDSPHLQHLIGRVYVRAKRWKDAERLFRKVIAFDPDALESHAGLARCLLEQSFPRRAAEAALAAINLKFDLPETHFVLGVALTRMRRFDRAERAFETCLALAPGATEAASSLENVRCILGRTSAQPV